MRFWDRFLRRNRLSRSPHACSTCARTGQFLLSTGVCVLCGRLTYCFTLAILKAKVLSPGQYYGLLKAEEVEQRRDDHDAD